MNKLTACIILCIAIGFTACDEKRDEHIAVTSITLDAENIALKLGDTQTLTATITPENASDRNVVWVSDDETIATVNSTTGVVTGRGLGKTTIWAIPITDYLPKSHCTVTVLATHPYAVGDLYPDVIAPQGMVFWIDPANPISGKIVSLDETRKRWGASEVATSALDSDDGKVNLSIIESLEDWRSNYPAFAWCAAKGEGWYLPALNELLMLYEAKEILNEIMLQNGDTPLATNDYWSSTERRLNPKTAAVTVIFRQMSENESWASKDGMCGVRAIRAF